MLDRARKLFHLFGASNFYAERFDVNVDARSRVGGLQDFIFKFRSATMGFPQARTFFHFKMQLDEKMPVVLVRGYFVNGEAAALSDCANGFKGVLVLPGARLHVDYHVRGNDLADALLHRFAGGVGLFETCRARNAYGDIDEISLAGAANAHALRA